MAVGVAGARTVALVRHADPSIDKAIPTSSWGLSPEGVASCSNLAEDLRPFLMRHWQVDPFALWKSLELPAYMAFTVPTFDIVGTSGVDATLLRVTRTGA